MPTRFLSICVPTYNRKALLERLLNSIVQEANYFYIEIVIVDDGSKDGTFELIEIFSAKFSNVIFKYLYQDNQGRGPALKKAILESTGEFIVIMDSDDYFLPGWSNMLVETMEVVRGKSSDKLVGAVFNVASTDNVRIGTKLPDTEHFLNLIEYRYDYGIKGDKKEFILGILLREIVSSVNMTERRVPTMLLWVLVAERGNCFLVNKNIAVKEYLQEGMSKNIKRLKINNPLSMRFLNEALLLSSTYKSKLYRLKAAIDYNRYSLLSLRFPRLRFLVIATLPLGLLLGVLDLIYRSIFIKKET